MNVDLGILGKLTRVVIFLIGVAGVLAVAVWYLPLIKQNEAYRQRVLTLDKQIAKEEESGKQLKSSIDSLRYDNKALERIARERMGYAKPGEVVIRFDEPSTNLLSRR